MLFYNYGIFNGSYRANDVVYTGGNSAEFDWEGDCGYIYRFDVCAALRQCVVWRPV